MDNVILDSIVGLVHYFAFVCSEHGRQILVDIVTVGKDDCRTSYSFILVYLRSIVEDLAFYAAVNRVNYVLGISYSFEGAIKILYFRL